MTTGTVTTADKVATTCPYCGVGCGVEVSRDGDGNVQVRGDSTHPANEGRLCSKGAARHDWWCIPSKVVRRMGFSEVFGYAGPTDIFSEHAGLSGVDNGSVRDFYISTLAGIDADTYARLRPFQWPLSGSRDSTRLFGDGRFFTADGKARFIALSAQTPRHVPDEDYPLILNSHVHTIITFCQQGIVPERTHCRHRC